MGAPLFPLKTYDLTETSLTINGQPVTGFGENAAISFEFHAQLVEPTVGADGLVVMSRTNDNLVTCKITVLESSPAVGMLMGLQVAQRALPAFTPYPFLFIDPLSGDEFADLYAVFMDRPSVAKTRKVGERIFSIGLPNAGRSGVFNLGGLP